MRIPRVIGILCLCLSPLARASDAPGAPGERATWASGAKQGVGTSTSRESPVWFTLGEGAINEVYYPAVDRANTRLVELVLSDGAGFFERETLDADHRIEIPDGRALVFRQVNTSRSGRYRVSKTIFTDPARPVVLIEASVEALAPGALTVHVLSDPAVSNSGLGDTAETREGALVAHERDTAVAVAASSGFAATNSGFLGSSDGLRELRAGLPLPGHARARGGNVVQLGRLPGTAVPARPLEFTIAIGFGPDPRAAAATARAGLAGSPAERRLRYAEGWHRYLAGLRSVRAPYDDQFAMAAMLLRAHEDKATPGAMIASLTIPWGDEVDASAGNVGGYHLVWSRDLYHVATAFEALGDRAAALRALDYLLRVQQRPDGSFPQNSWLDGRPFWPSVQMDEVAFPILLAQQLDRTDERTWRRHLRPAAEFILAHGPVTPQERWEEEAGYSPAAIAAQIAGLVAAAEIAEGHGEVASAARYREAADAWDERLPLWTATRNGPHAPVPYFVRIAQQGNPDAGQPIELNNGAGSFDERAIVDAGFLELVRLGIRSATDPLVTASLAVVDRALRVATPHGPAFYRYNHDGYGEKPDGRGWDGTGVGRLWPLLAGERGEYELMAGRDPRPYLDAMLGSANEGRMLPEQVWDRPEAPRAALRFGEGTRAATPLAWACAQFIRLALAVEERRPVGLPEVVRAHFAARHPAARPAPPEAR